MAKRLKVRRLYKYPPPHLQPWYNYRLWSDEEKEYLRQNYVLGDPAEISKRLARKWRTICCYAKGLGLHRKGLRYDKPTLTLSDIEKSYIAGFLDGEGSISLTATKRKSGRCNYTVRICIGNTNFDVMTWISERVDKPLEPVDLPRIDRRGIRLNMAFYRLVIQDFGAIEVLLQMLLPYLIVKKHQAELALKWVSHQLYSAINHEYSGEELAIIEEFKHINRGTKPAISLV